MGHVGNQPNFSTGPRTEEGKARSAMNAIKHGYTAANLVFTSDEDREMLHLLEKGLRTELKPKGCFEETIFTQLLAATWNLHRIRAMEAQLALDPENAHPMLGKDPTRAFDRLLRYQRLNERTPAHAIKELTDQQTRRMIAEKIGHTLLSEEEETIPATADTKKVQWAMIQAERHLTQSAAASAPSIAQLFEMTAPPRIPRDLTGSPSPG